MSTTDIFSMITDVLNKNKKDDIKGLSLLSQVSKELNNIVKYNTNYDAFIKLIQFKNIYEAVEKTVDKAIDDNTNEENIIDYDNAIRIAFENIEYIIPYITKQDIIDINFEICVTYINCNDTDMPRKYINKYRLYGKILRDFIKKVDINYKIHLLPWSFTYYYGIKNDSKNYNDYIVIDKYKNDFDIWLYGL